MMTLAPESGICYSILWNAITYPCLSYLLQTPMSSFNMAMFFFVWCRRFLWSSTISILLMLFMIHKYKVTCFCYSPWSNFAGYGWRTAKRQTTQTILLFLWYILWAKQLSIYACIYIAHFLKVYFVVFRRYRIKRIVLEIVFKHGIENFEHM